MINQEPFDQHFVISHELLDLLEWLAHHEQENLKKLIRYALKHGFTAQKTQACDDNKELQATIVNFLGLIDFMLEETKNEETSESFVQRSLIPAVKNIDAATYDSPSIETNIARAAEAASAKHTAASSKDVFCRELLKNWKPHKKIAVH